MKSMRNWIAICSIAILMLIAACSSDGTFGTSSETPTDQPVLRLGGTGNDDPPAFNLESGDYMIKAEVYQGFAEFRLWMAVADGSFDRSDPLTKIDVYPEELNPDGDACREIPFKVTSIPIDDRNDPGYRKHQFPPGDLKFRIRTGDTIFGSRDSDRLRWDMEIHRSPFPDEICPW